MRSRRTPRIALGIAATVAGLALLGASGCSDDGRVASDQDLEVVGDGAPFGGRFDDVPLHPRSSPISELAQREGTVARSYAVDGASIDQVMAFYEDSLPALGWDLVVDPERSGTSTIQAEWTDGEVLLRITATDAPALGGDTDPTEAVSSQYSLSMSDR